MLFKTDIDILNQLGERFKSIRLALNLTQAELALKSNVSESTIKALESGRGCSLPNLIRLARVTGRINELDQLFNVIVRPTDRLKNKVKPTRVRASRKNREC